MSFTNQPTPIAVTVMALTEIRPDPTNPRKHTKRQTQKLAAAYSEFGYINPLLVDEQAVIIAGHGRWLAAQHLGLKEVPVILLRGLTQSQKKALRIADNKIAEDSTWDLAVLATELQDLIATKFEVELTGFDPIELDRLLTPPSIAGEDDDVPFPPGDPVSKPGDLWQCGDHRILCADTRDETSFERLLDGHLADLVVTDVPYNLRMKGMVSGLGAKVHGDFEMASGEMLAPEFIEFLKLVMGLARDHSRDGSLHYHFIDWRHIADMVTIGRELFEALLNICVWAKTNGGMGSFYRSQHEMVAVFKHGKTPHINNVQLGRLGRYRSNLWQYAGANSFSSTRNVDLADHPTVKPIAMVSDAIRDASRPGDLVLDPFGGSGTTLLAAQTTKRRAALIEISPGFVDVTLNRFMRATNLEPVLLPWGEPFSKVAAQRRGGGND